MWVGLMFCYHSAALTELVLYVCVLDVLLPFCRSYRAGFMYGRADVLLPFCRSYRAGFMYGDV